jgi:hypothetical protein
VGRRTRVFAVIAVLCALGYIAYIATYPRISLRYRLTLDVVVDGVTHTGSGVVEIVYNFEPHPLNIDDIQFYPGHLRGNAITVDLAPRGILLVVDAFPMVRDPETRQFLYREYTTLASLPLRANDFGRQNLVTEPQTIREIKRNRQLIQLPPSELPMLVWFPADAGPKSLNNITEADAGDLQSSIGSGARIHSRDLPSYGRPYNANPSGLAEMVS